MAATDEFIIDRKGDLFLTVGDELRLLASSKIMTLASPVFDAMLGASFTEGQQNFTMKAPGNIDLPEDDADAMKTFCRLVHFHPYREVLKATTLDEFFALAVVADKYDCSRAIEPMIIRCFVKLEKEHRAFPQRVVLWTIAMILGYEDWFHHLSTELFRQYTGLSLVTMVPDQVGDRLPVGLEEFIKTHNLGLRVTVMRATQILLTLYFTRSGDWHFPAGYVRSSDQEACTFLELPYPKELLNHSTTWINEAVTIAAIKNEIAQLRFRSHSVNSFVVKHCPMLREIQGNFCEHVKCIENMISAFKPKICLLCCRKGEIVMTGCDHSSGKQSSAVKNS